MPETRFDKGYAPYCCREKDGGRDLQWRRFLLNMMAYPEMTRNVAVVGHLHHGKTALMDMLVFETHKLLWDSDKPVRTDAFIHSP